MCTVPPNRFRGWSQAGAKIPMLQTVPPNRFRGWPMLQTMPPNRFRGWSQAGAKMAQDGPI